MSFEGLEPVADVSVGDWIAPRLRRPIGSVHSVVPGGFAAYVRVLHPAADARGEPLAWAEVCRRTGRTAHALMQWSSIAGAGAQDPQIGEAPRDLLAPLLDVLGRCTADPGACFHALWEGWGWLHPGGWGILVSASGDADPAPPPAERPGLPYDVLRLPRLRLPDRDYLLFRGPLAAAERMGHQVTDDWFVPQSPSLLWPADRSWCLATEIDFDSTLIGGPAELADALLDEPALEAWPVSPDGDLTIGGDVVNPPPA